VSVPEKTLEHWASQYLLFRFRSKARVWWPAFGTDIDVRNLPSQAPGTNSEMTGGFILESTDRLNEPRQAAAETTD
jgi:hypothetical protein